MKYFLSLLFVFTLLQSNAQTLCFQQTIGDKEAEANTVLKTTGGGYLLAGKTWNLQNTGYDIFLVKLDSIGNILWKKTYGDSLVYEWETDIQKTQDGGYIMTGQSFDLNTFLSNTFILKTDSLGNISWHQSFGGSLLKIIVQPNGYLFGGVISTIGSGNNDFYLLKTDFNGNVLWSKSYGGQMVDALSDMCAYKNGWLLAGSSNSNINGETNNYFIRTDSVGNTLYEYAIGDTTQEEITAIVRKPNNSLIVAGTQYFYDTLGIKHRAISLYQLNDSFQIVWQKTLFCGFHSDVHKIVLTKPDNGIAICGTKQDADTLPTDGFLIKTDSVGQVQWAKSYGATNDDALFDCVQMNDTGFALAGNSKSFNSSGYNNIYLAKTNLQGNSFCNSTNLNVLQSNATFSVYFKHSNIDTGVIIANNIFLTDTLGMNSIICTNYVPANVETVVNENDFNISPNPITETIFINAKEDGNLVCYSVDGTVIFTTSFNKGKNAINSFRPERGIYFYEATFKNSVAKRGKLMVQ